MGLYISTCPGWWSDVTNDFAIFKSGEFRYPNTGDAWFIRNDKMPFDKFLAYNTDRETTPAGTFSDFVQVIPTDGPFEIGPQYVVTKQLDFPCLHVWQMIQ